VRVGLVGVLMVLALSACNGSLPEAPQPPFGVIGPWTGSVWRAIGPGLGGPLDPSSSNICQSGKPACMNAVVGEMTQRLNALGCSQLAPFQAMYRWVSREVRISVQRHRYRDPAYVTHLDAVFSTLYYHALDDWRSGHVAAVPQVWRMAFSAAAHHQVSTLGDMLLGMNAHVSRDLAFALASVGLKEPGGASAVPDVVAINADIDRAQGPTLAEERAAYDPELSLPRGVPHWLTVNRIPELIAQWRLEAIQNARALIDASSHAARVEIETRIDDTATLRSLLIWRATAYVHPAADSAARDAYCASRLAGRRSGA
jgi:uncharacterized protein DUF5995